MAREPQKTPKVTRYEAEDSDKARGKKITSSQMTAADEARSQQAAQAREAAAREKRGPKLGRMAIQPTMSWDDWNALGPMGRVRGKDDEVYDGGPVDSGPEAVRAMQSKIAVGGSNKKYLLHNTHHISTMDGFTAGKSMRDSLHRLLLDPHQANLEIKRAAKGYDEASQMARRLGDGPDKFTVISVSKEAADTGRDFIETAVEFFPISKGVKPQDLSRNLSEEDIAAFTSAYDAKNSLPQYRARVLDEKGKPELLGEDNAGKKTYKGVIGIVCTPATRAAAVEWASKQGADMIVAPFPDSALLKMIAEKSRHTKDHPRYAMAWGARQTPHNQLASFLKTCDEVVTVTNDPFNENSPINEVIAEAERHGKNAKVMNARGFELDARKVGMMAMTQCPSFKERQRAEALQSFEIPIGSPESRYAISKVRFDKGMMITPQDINKLAPSEMTLTEIIDIAATPAGQEALRDQYRIAPAAIRALADDQMMAKATTAFEKGMEELSANDTRLVGIEHMSDEGIRSGETYCFARGNVDVLRDAKASVLFAGEAIHGDDQPSKTARNIVASQNAPLLAEAVKQDLTIISVAGETSVAPPVTANQIVVLPGGHAHSYGADEDKRISAVIAAGGVVVSNYPPETKSSYYDAATKLDQYVSSAPSEETRPKAMTFAVNLAEQTVIQSFNRKEQNSVIQHTAEKALQKAIANTASDTRPIVVDFSKYKDLSCVSGNNALLKGSAAKAMKAANLKTSVVESLAPKFEGAPAVISAGPDPVLAAKNLASIRNGRDADLPEVNAAVQGREY
jgi:hypothetical protein